MPGHTDAHGGPNKPGPSGFRRDPTRGNNRPNMADIAEDKMELNDKHQKLRASVSLAKEGVKEMTAIVGEDE
mgnify:CR=1 FL=1